MYEEVRTGQAKHGEPVGRVCQGARGVGADWRCTGQEALKVGGSSGPYVGAARPRRQAWGRSEGLLFLGWPDALRRWWLRSHQQLARLLVLLEEFLEGRGTLVQVVVGAVLLELLLLLLLLLVKLPLVEGEGLLWLLL
jgi:hypothetical protein